MDGSESPEPEYVTFSQPIWTRSEAKGPTPARSAYQSKKPRPPNQSRPSTPTTRVKRSNPVIRPALPTPTDPPSEARPRSTTRSEPATRLDAGPCVSWSAVNEFWRGASPRGLGSDAIARLGATESKRSSTVTHEAAGPNCQRSPMSHSKTASGPSRVPCMIPALALTQRSPDAATPTPGIPGHMTPCMNSGAPVGMVATS